MPKDIGVVQKRRLVILLPPRAQAERIHVQGPSLEIELPWSCAWHEVDEVMVIMQRIFGGIFTCKYIYIGLNLGCFDFFTIFGNTSLWNGSLHNFTNSRTTAYLCPINLYYLTILTQVFTLPRLIVLSAQPNIGTNSMSCGFRFLSGGSSQVFFHEFIFFLPQGNLVVSTELAIELHLFNRHSLLQFSTFGFSLLVIILRRDILRSFILDVDDPSHCNRRLWIVEARSFSPKLVLCRWNRILLFLLTFRLFQQILTRMSLQPLVGNLRI